MSSAEPVKVSWTWEEWLSSREARREVAARVGPEVVRRARSSSDRRLRRLFEGERGPDFRNGGGGNRSAGRDEPARAGGTVPHRVEQGPVEYQPSVGLGCFFGPGFSSGRSDSRSRLRSA